MVACKTVCLRRLGGNRKGEERVGRFFANRKVTAEKIVAGWSSLTGAACAGRHVLLIEDRSEVKFPTTAQRRRGLGPVKKGNSYGILIHAMIAVDAASGCWLGLVGGDVWSRDGVNPIRHGQRPLAERQSVHWVETAQQAKQVVHSAALLTVVGDREADIYPLWGSVPDPTCHVLTRAMADRALVGGGTLFAAAAQFPLAGRREIDPRLRKGRPAGARSRPAQAPRAARTAPRRGGDLSSARRTRPQPAAQRAAAPDRGAADRSAGRCGAAALAAADHAPDRRHRRGLGDRRLVPTSLGDRAVVPGAEIAGAATGGQPGGLGGSAGHACRRRHQSRLHRHPTDARPRRRGSDARQQPVQRAGDRHPGGAAPDAGRRHRPTTERLSTLPPRRGGLDHRQAGRLELLLQTARTDHLPSRHGAVLRHPSRQNARNQTATRCENPPVRRRGAGG